MSPIQAIHLVGDEQLAQLIGQSMHVLFESFTVFDGQAFSFMHPPLYKNLSESLQAVQ